MEKIGHPKTFGNGRYTIQRRLGAGGEGAVFLAYDGTLKRWVAIKQIHNQGEQSPKLVETSAIREATHLASLQHPNIITVHDIVRSNDEVLVVMEYMPGQTVDDLNEPMDASFFVDFASQCLLGLAAAHAIGMVHRDIKPGNIMIAGQHSGGFQVKILDFGLAKVIEEPSLQTLDQSGALMGSIFMMSPEQLEARPIDHRTDLYSLGCVFYKSLTRKHPFRGKSVPAVVAAHLAHDHDPLASLRPDLPQPLISWVERLFAQDRETRPPSASEALKSLPSIRKAQASNFRSSPALPIQPPLALIPPGSASKQKILLAATAGALLLAGASYWTLGAFSKATPHSSIIAQADKKGAGRTSFSWKEREAILRRKGQSATITGTIGGFKEDKSGRFHLTFKEATPRDASLCFDRSKGDFSMVLLKKNVGLDIQATGIVGTESQCAYLQNPTLREVVIPKASPPAQK